MADAMTATPAARFAGGAATISDLGPVGMVTLRADLADPAVAEALSAQGFALPGLRRFAGAPGSGAGWFSPDELLLVTEYGRAPGLATALSEGLAGRHALAVNVSDARAMFRIEGRGARGLIAKGAPVDLSPAAFGPGDLRRTRLGQVACAFWMGEDEAFSLVCFRSLGAHVFAWLRAGAALPTPPGF